MKTNIQIFEFNGSQIEFDLSNNVMVNATEMAEIYGKKVEAFMRNSNTEDFVLEALKSENSSFLGIQNRDDLFVSRQRSGTWMHRVLALKFAAWLNPAFELWVYSTIDKIMFGTLREDVKEKTNYETDRDSLYQKLISENPEFVRYVELDQKAKAAAGNIKKQMRTQLILFKDI